ncbi:hypothetical protein QKQ66_gp029 [Dione juno nucleopolyhedrovirus]|uniref:P22.2 n=1 Tax=Dione juno nucleopolyhedrovirus TaxID=2594175 RepID=A0AAE6H334_9ABAC|nr:hypothetical protein QKQ66_gp029 [Dione juno nucleopolyhedrovirus]QDL56945.1 hypothetical protein DijuNPV-ORF-29 [Dione juno nucleopolyhedrovirus]
MKAPAITVYYDGRKQDFVRMACDRSDGVVRMQLTYDKQAGSDHVLKVNVKTGRRTLTVFRFGEKTFRLIGHSPTFDGFYDDSSRRTKQFRLGDFNVVKQLVQHDQQQLNKLANQIPELSIVIKEWVDETTPRWATDGCTKGRVVYDGGYDEIDGGETDGSTVVRDKLSDDTSRPVGYETNVLNENKYMDVEGKEGPVIAEIKIKFVSKQFINIV